MPIVRHRPPHSDDGVCRAIVPSAIEVWSFIEPDGENGIVMHVMAGGQSAPLLALNEHMALELASALNSAALVIGGESN